MVAGVHAGLPGIGNRNMTGGTVRVQGRDVFRRLPSLPVVPPPFIGKSRSYPCPPQDLLLCAKHLFVAAIVAGVYPGLPRTGKSGRDGGRPRLEPVKCSEAAKAKRRRHHRQARFAPRSKICYSAPKICSWQPWCQFCPWQAGRLTQRTSSALDCERTWLQSRWCKGGLACTAIMRGLNAPT